MENLKGISLTKSYVADAVALARFMEGSLTKSADIAFQEAEQGEAQIILPDIVIGEFIYSALKGRLRTNDPKSMVQEMLDQIDISPHFKQTAMTRGAWQAFLQSPVRELHDRMIHSIAQDLSANAIITSDEEIRKSGFPTIW